jgi:hypothetical protein
MAGHDTWRIDGDVTVRLMFPEKPYKLERVIVSVFEEPALKDSSDGPDKPKSEMVTLRTTPWFREPLVPVILRLYCPAGRPAPHVGY